MQYSRCMSMTVLSIAQMTDDEARAFFESVRWPEGPVCHRCGSFAMTRLQGKATRPGLFKCRDCRQQSRVETGTVMHGSRLGLRKWLMAFFILASSKMSVSALQLQRQLGIGSYKTAWHLCHRVRWAMANSDFTKELGGPRQVVEVDEIFLGGREKSRHRKNRGQKKKMPVLALVERGGAVRALPVERVDAATLRPAIVANVDSRSPINPDGWRGYQGLGRHFDAHDSVDHQSGEYVRGFVHSQTVESFFGLIRRGVMGAFHSISRQHLGKYVTEFAFRFGLNKATDEERTLQAIRQSDGVRLTYYTPKPLRLSA